MMEQRYQHGGTPEIQDGDGISSTPTSILGQTRKYLKPKVRTPKARYNEKFVLRLQRVLDEDLEADLSSLLKTYDNARFKLLRG
jgi:hypothetical protein